MTKYEALASEYDDTISIEERYMQNKGLYGDNIIWIKKDLTEAEKTCILAEEIGHYETSSGDITDQTDLSNIKQELRARKWAHQKLVPLEAILEAAVSGHTELWDMAEYLDVEETFLKEALIYYGLL